MRLETRPPGWRPASPFDRVRVTVAPGGADFEGDTHRPIQAAVEYVAAFGGGTVEVLPGTYRMGNAVHLRPWVRLVGHGDATVLLKNPSFTTPLVDDTDWYDWTAAVEDPSGFEVGGGLFLRAKSTQGSAGGGHTKHTITAIEGNVLTLDRQPRKNLWLKGEATASTLFPILTANWVNDIAIEGITLDGNRDQNENLNGNYGGGIFLQDCERVRIAGVTSRNYNGDGFSWQICHDVTVEDCRSLDNRDLGLHPGSGSQRPVIRNNEVRNCGIGLFWCWGVKHGLAEGNTLSGSGEFGISVGYRDTDNVMRNNRVLESRHAAVLFREGSSPDRSAPHRCVVEGNLLQGGGTAKTPAIAIRIDGAPDGLVIRGNHIINPEGSHLATGIRIGPRVTHVTLEGNTFEGVATTVEDQRG
ncbi:MAG: right-handed parallel beta-helix repeat-containing protein [Armatimonadetes bacterium]|nr:right-handed parallel beta-helix repeat-containing protein [Armatimonadota bacterium]